MTQEEFFADLKQYITAENSALEKRLEASIDQKLEEKLEQKLEEKLEQKLEEKLNQKFDEKLAPIHQKIDDLAAFMQDALATSNEINQEQLDDHEARITRLEKAAA
ncbi:MAG: hypothetical protein WBO35_02665 [Candidatus Saccharimonadales bacterium]